MKEDHPHHESTGFTPDKRNEAKSSGKRTESGYGSCCRTHASAGVPLR